MVRAGQERQRAPGWDVLLPCGLRGRLQDEDGLGIHKQITTNIKQPKAPAPQLGRGRHKRKSDEKTSNHIRAAPGPPGAWAAGPTVHAVHVQHEHRQPGLRGLQGEPLLRGALPHPVGGR